MKFSKNEIEYMSKLAEERVSIQVTGVNKYGQRFSLVGFIVPAKSALPGHKESETAYVSETGFWMYCGQENTYENETQSVFIPVYNSMPTDEDAKESAFYIDSIYEDYGGNDGVSSYDNPDFKEIESKLISVNGSDAYPRYRTIKGSQNKELIELVNSIGSPISYVSDNSQNAQKVVVSAVRCTTDPTTGKSKITLEMTNGVCNIETFKNSTISPDPNKDSHMEIYANGRESVLNNSGAQWGEN